MLWITLHSIFNLLHVHFPWAFFVDVDYIVIVAQVVLRGMILCLPLVINLFCFPAVFLWVENSAISNN